MLSKKIKEESILIKKIMKKNNNFKFYNEVESLSILTSSFLSLITVLSFVLILINNEDLFTKFFFGIILFLIGLVLYMPVVCAILMVISYIIKGSITKKYIKNISPFFDLNYITKIDRVLEFENLYNKLSMTGKEVYFYLKKQKGVKIEKISQLYFEKEINKMSTKEFIDYYKHEYIESDINIKEVDTEYAICNEILNIFVKMDYNEFNKHKDDIIKITLTLKDKSKQLTIINKLEEIKDKYDEEHINNKIENKINKITETNKIEKNNKILRSI